MHFEGVTGDDTNGNACEPFKKTLRGQSDGYKAEEAASRIKEAIQRAKDSDIDPDHFITQPTRNQTIPISRADARVHGARVGIS